MFRASDDIYPRFFYPRVRNGNSRFYCHEKWVFAVGLAHSLKLDWHDTNLEIAGVSHIHLEIFFFVYNDVLFFSVKLHFFYFYRFYIWIFIWFQFFTLSNLFS